MWKVSGADLEYVLMGGVAGGVGGGREECEQIMTPIKMVPFAPFSTPKSQTA